MVDVQKVGNKLILDSKKIYEHDKERSTYINGILDTVNFVNKKLNENKDLVNVNILEDKILNCLVNMDDNYREGMLYFPSQATAIIKLLIKEGFILE